MKAVLSLIDAVLNKLTMYRVVLYELLFLIGVAMVLGQLGLLPYSPMYLALSTAFIVAVAWVVNKLFALVFEAPSNFESVVITALILVLIITPPQSLGDMSYWPLAFWAAALAMASKYILAIGKKHLFNPAALAVAVTALALNQSASWWVGTALMLPFVLAGGLLIVRKIHRFDLVLAFLAVAFATTVGFEFIHHMDPVIATLRFFLSTPIIFFASVMLTEPMTTPPTRWLRIPEGVCVGILFAPFAAIGSFYFTPELALLAGNLGAYIVSPKQKLVLVLQEVHRLATDTYDFVFKADRPVTFRAGQYMEFTLAHAHADSRGIRRYFTLASAPSEPFLHLGVKFYAKGSSFKKALTAMQKGDALIASQLAGDFVLPRDAKKKLAFIAGGIGATPFRAMVQEVIDSGAKRDIALLYSNKTPADAAYKELFDLARDAGVRTTYAFTDPSADLSSIPGAVRAFDAQTVAAAIPDFRERTFYLSGPRGMVTAFDDILRSMGVPSSRIKKDFFPGFA